MKEIILIGGGGHCRSVIDVIEQEGQYKIVGIIDKAELFGTDVLGYPVFGSDLDIENLDLENNDDQIEDDTVLLEDETDVDPAADAGIKPTDEGEEEY